MASKYNFFKDATYIEQVSRSNSWGHHFIFLNLLLALFSSLAYIYAAPSTNNFISFFYLIVTYFGHTSFLFAIIFLCLYFPLAFIGNYRYYRVILVLISVILHTILLFDIKLYLTVKTHLSLTTLNLMFTSLDFKTGLNYNFLYIAIPIIIGFELFFAKLTTKFIYKTYHSKFYDYIGMFFFACFIVSHALHIWGDAVGYEKITTLRTVFPAHYPTTAKTFLTSHGYIDNNNIKDIENSTFKLKYPLSKIEYGKHSNISNVFYININGLSFDDINENKQSKLYVLMNENHNFTNFYLPYDSVYDNLFATTYSLPIKNRDSILKQDIVPVVLSLMQRQEFKIKMFTSKALDINLIKDNTNLMPYQIYDFNSDNDSIENFKEAILTINENESHFYTLFLNDLTKDNISKKEYDKKLKSLDDKITSLVDFINDTNNGRECIIVISSLKGNEFYKNNNEVYQRQKLHVPMFFMSNQHNVKDITSFIASSYDLAPTIAENILKVKSKPQDYSIGNNLVNLNKRDFIISDKPSLLLISSDFTTVYLENGHSFIESNKVKQEVKPNLEDLIKSMQILNRFKE